MNPPPVKRILGILAQDPSLFEEALEACRCPWGREDLRSEVLPFEQTDYYAAEMGSPLWRLLVAFEGLVPADRAAEDKRVAREIENLFKVGGNRRVNLDPGYVDAARLVLSTTKDRAHRIYLGGGIYAEVTLTWHRGGWRTYPWTYPDFRGPAYHPFLTRVRQRYRDQIRER